jgi:hypothetical protein
MNNFLNYWKDNFKQSKDGFDFTMLVRYSWHTKISII